MRFVPSYARSTTLIHIRLSCAWVMADAEIHLWDGMFRGAIGVAATVSVDPAVVVNMVLRWLGDHKVDR